jgi:hypothetical protein
MRFFSNDARENTDEQTTEAQAGEARDGHPDRVQSDPVAVPNQRPPSPWSDTPPANDDTVRADAVADDTDPPPFHEPSPQPTAFGASTVGGAVAASAMANPLNDRWDATDRDSAADTGVGDDANVAPGDGVVTSSNDSYAGTVAPPETVSTWPERDGQDRTDPDGVVDVPLDDKSTSADGGVASAGAVSARSDALDTDRYQNQDDSVTSVDDQNAVLKDDGGFDAPRAVDPATDRPLDSSTVDDSDRAGADTNTDTDTTTAAATTTDTDAGPLKDEGGFEDPKVVDPATDAPIDAADTSGTTVAAAVPVAAAAAGSPDKLFDQEDARGFQERWRDVQLRFVDSPKDAAADAAKLVDEAVDKLTASLRSQREGLGNDTDDTEQLRVQLRGYRDVLNRILSL